MSADLLERLSQQDVRIWLEDGELRYSALRGWMTEGRRCWLREHKPAILEAPQTQPANDCLADAATASAAPTADLIHWRGLSPEQLKNLWAQVQAGEPIQIYSDTLGEAVWWVRDEAQADELKSQGINEAIYAADELRELAGQSAEFLRDVHQFKRRFGASLMSVAAAQPEPAATTPGSDTANLSAGQVACGDCQHFTPDTLGDGTGIGRCEAGCVARPGVDMPYYPRAPQYCTHFHGNEASPC